MEDSNHLLEQLAARSKDLTFVYDYAKKQFKFWGNAAQDFLGFTVEEINRKVEKLLELIPEEDQPHVLRETARLKEGEESIDIDFRIFTADQQLKWLRLKAYRLQKDSPRFGGTLEDITSRKEQELGMLAIKEQKNITIQVLGHDLRAPLNTISLSMNLINQEISAHENEKINMLVDIVERTCRNSLDMIKEIINIEFTETQALGIKKNRIDILNRIQNQIDTFRLLDKSGKTFIFHKTAESIFIHSDNVRFMLIIENLLTNAYKFTGVDGRIEISAEEQTNSILIKIADNGIGIPEKLKPLIFDKFTKARRKGTQGEQTVGLGMHLVRTLVEQLEGKIWFESQEGKGTTFFVELPK